MSFFQTKRFLLSAAVILQVFFFSCEKLSDVEEDSDYRLTTTPSYLPVSGGNSIYSGSSSSEVYSVSLDYNSSNPNLFVLAEVISASKSTSYSSDPPFVIDKIENKKLTYYQLRDLKEGDGIRIGLYSAGVLVKETILYPTISNLSKADFQYLVSVSSGIYGIGAGGDSKLVTSVYNAELLAAHSNKEVFAYNNGSYLYLYDFATETSKSIGSMTGDLLKFIGDEIYYLSNSYTLKKYNYVTKVSSTVRSVNSYNDYTDYSPTHELFSYSYFYNSYSYYNDQFQVGVIDHSEKTTLALDLEGNFSDPNYYNVDLNGGVGCLNDATGDLIYFSHDSIYSFNPSTLNKSFIIDETVDSDSYYGVETVFKGFSINQNSDKILMLKKDDIDSYNSDYWYIREVDLTSKKGSTLLRFTDKSVNAVCYF